MLKSHLALHGFNDAEEEKPVEEEMPGELERKVGDEEENEIAIHVGPRNRESQRHLKKSEVSIRLSFLGKTADGDGYTYLKATLTGMGLTHIDAIKSFKHLQYLDVSENNLRLDELQVITNIPYLLLLQADKNNLDTIALHKMAYMQVLIINDNNITTVDNVYQPELSTLEVGFNKIKKIQLINPMPNIRCLDFRNNMLTDITDMNFPKLDSLYLANNNIASLVGIEKLVTLRILHVRNNPIRLLDGFHEDLKKLIYVNLRNCKVSTMTQVKKLRVLKGIETLVLKGCPIMGGTGEEGAGGGEEDDNDIRVEILATLPRLKRLNKGNVTLEEREEAKTLMLQWVEDGENDEEEMEGEMLNEENFNPV